jgi:hypothetical protein
MRRATAEMAPTAARRPARAAPGRAKPDRRLVTQREVADDTGARDTASISVTRLSAANHVRNHNHLLHAGEVNERGIYSR